MVDDDFFFLMVFLRLWNLNFPNLSSSIRTKRCVFFSPNYKYIPKSSHFTRSLKSLVLGFTLYLTLMPQNKQKSYFKIFESPCSMPFRSSAWLESAFFLFCKGNYTFISPRNEAPLYTNAKSQKKMFCMLSLGSSILPNPGLSNHTPFHQVQSVLTVCMFVP